MLNPEDTTITWRGKAGEMLSGILDKAEPCYRKDVRDHMSNVLGESDPVTVRSMMDDIAAQMQQDAERARSLQQAQIRALKGSYATLDPYGRNETD